MQIETGVIVEGKITGITDFGAFVEIEGGKTGMVHISEVALDFVRDIREHLEIGQQVKCKVVSVSPEGKISLSIRKALEETGEVAPRPEKKKQQRRKDGKRTDLRHHSFFTPCSVQSVSGRIILYGSAVPGLISSVSIINAAMMEIKWDVLLNTFEYIDWNGPSFQSPRLMVEISGIEPLTS